MTSFDSNAHGSELSAPIHTYGTFNKAVAVVGLIVLVLCFTLQSRGNMTGQLLCIGLFFLTQVSPVAVLFAHEVLPIQRRIQSEHHLSTEPPLESTRVFNILPPVPIGIAILLYVSFVVFDCFQSRRFEGNQLAKLGALTITNLIFAITILWHYAKLKTSSAEQFVERYRELTRMGPIIIFGSILVTTYFFAKEIMFSLDLHELRPTMMSLFLQLIAIAIFFALSRAEPVLPAQK